MKDSCEEMLRCIERYQDFTCGQFVFLPSFGQGLHLCSFLSELSQEENALGRFLKQRGKADKTQAGKMMSAVGRAQSFTAQQRFVSKIGNPPIFLMQ